MVPLPDIGLEKALAFDFLERNATQIALLGDSIFYFGELGMQEFETAKLMTSRQKRRKGHHQPERKEHR